MTPGLLLSVWRARWGRPDTALRAPDALEGPFSAWFEARCRSRLAHHPAAWVLGWATFGFLALVALGLRFSLAEQVLFGLSILLLALVLHGTATDAVLTVLGALAAWMGLRYAHWRAFDSLSHQQGIELAWMLLMLALEWLAALAWWVQVLHRTWPLTHPPEPLPSELSHWPQLGMVVLVGGVDGAQTQRTLEALQGLTWPTQKRVLLVMDDAERSEIRALAQSAGAYYATDVQAANRRGAQVNRVISEFEWPYALVLQAGQTPTDAWLHAAVGCLLARRTRALISTPDHPWLAAQPDLANANLVVPSANHVLLLRRQAFLAVGGFAEDTKAQTQTLDQALVRADHHHLVLGYEADGTLVAVPAPLGALSLRLRGLLHRLAHSLRIFWPQWTAAFAFVPLVYALTGWRPMDADPLLWLAYALPAWLLAGIFSRRLGSQQPRSLRSLWTNWPLMAYLTILTPFSVIWALLRQVQRTGLPELWRLSRPQSRRDWAWVGVFALQGWALAQCGWELASPAPFQRVDWAGAGAIVSGVLIWLMLIGLAIRQEAVWVASHLQRLRQTSVSVRNATGRTLTGVTLNFPDLPLVLRLHKPRLLNDESRLSLTLMHELHALHLQAPVLRRDGAQITVGVDPSEIGDYDAFAQAMLSRPAQWPMWLPPAPKLSWRLPHLPIVPASFSRPAWLRWPLRSSSQTPAD